MRIVEYLKNLVANLFGDCPLTGSVANRICNVSPIALKMIG